VCLSPLPFCVAFIPLIHALNRSKCGYHVRGTERKISHLLYIDDLKLIGRCEEKLRNEITTVKTSGNDIKLSLDKKNVPDVFKKWQNS
jgi:hypothetical protein